jgi:hypothetical protein
MNTQVLSVLSLIKKFNFEKVNKKDPEITQNSVAQFDSFINAQKDFLLESNSEENTQLILINAILERAKELTIIKLTYKKSLKKDIFPNYLENVISLHNDLATTI